MTKVIIYEQEDLDLYHQYVQRKSDIILNNDISVWYQDESNQQEFDRMNSFLNYFFDKYLHQTEYHEERENWEDGSDDLLMNKTQNKVIEKLEKDLAKKKAESEQSTN